MLFFVLILSFVSGVFSKWSDCGSIHGFGHRLQHALSEHLVGQPHALELIHNAVATWEDDLSNGKNRPLKLFLSGTTGTGKTMTAKKIAEAYFNVDDISFSDATDGFLYVLGQNFIESDEIPLYHKQLYDKLHSRLGRCSGTGVVIFDELQKSAPGILHYAESMLSEESAFYSYPGADVPVDTSKTVFVFISDIGLDVIEALVEQSSVLTDSYSSDSNYKLPRLIRNRVTMEFEERSAIAKQSGYNEISISRYLDAVVPFLPFSVVNIRTLYQNRINVLESNLRHRELLDTLIVTDNVLNSMLRPKYTSYVMKDSNGTDSLCRRSRQLLSSQKPSFGGRHEDPSSVVVYPDGSAVLKNHPNSLKGELALVYSPVCGEPCILPGSCYVRDGARALVSFESSPPMRLRSSIENALAKNPDLLKEKKRRMNAVVRSRSGGFEDTLSSIFSNIKGFVKKVAKRDYILHPSIEATMNEAYQNHVWEGEMKEQLVAFLTSCEGTLSVEPDSYSSTSILIDADCASHQFDNTCNLKDLSYIYTRTISQDVHAMCSRSNTKNKLRLTVNFSEILYKGDF